MGENRNNGGRQAAPAQRPNAVPDVISYGDSPGGRSIRAIRDYASTDPIRRYYASRGIAPVEDYAWRANQVVPSSHLLFGTFSFENVDEHKPLSVENEGSITVNWSYPGYELYNNRDVILKGIEAVPQARWSSAVTLQNSDVLGDQDGTVPFDPQRTASQQEMAEYLIYSSSLPGPLGQSSDLNMAQSLAALANQAKIQRIQNTDEERALLSAMTFVSHPHTISGQLAAAGLNRDMVGGDGDAQYWSRFGDDNGAVRPARNAWELQQVIQSLFPENIAIQAALAAYPIDTYMSQASGSYVDYNFFDFEVPAPLVEDYVTTFTSLSTPVGVSDPNAPSIAFINPEYNFYNRRYEEAAANPLLPETILPNMYIYELGNRYGNFPIDGAPSWQGSKLRQKEVANGYDKMLTLDEFDKGVLPNLESPEFQQYLETYANAVQSKPLSVDLFGDINSKNSNTITPAGDMDIYPQFYDKRHAFPMYIEVGVPTAPLGPFGKMVEKTATSAGFMSSLTVSTPSNFRFNMTTSAFTVPTNIEDPFALRHTRHGPYLNQGVGITINNTRVFDFSDWFDAVASSTIMSVLTKKGIDLPVGVDVNDCLDYMTQLQLTSIRRGIEAASLQKMVPYEDCLRGKKLCEAETIIYRVTKYRVTDGQADDLIQTYYFPNTSFTDVINFVDTQVKYNVLYRYELHAFAVVYGSKFRFRTRKWVAPPNPVLGSNVYFSFNVETLPDLKIVEYPIFSNLWQRVTDQGGQEMEAGGVRYPIVKVMDRPPMPPEINIFPYKTSPTEVLINLSPATGEFLVPRTRPYIPFSAEEEAAFEELSRQQKIQEAFRLRRGHLEYKSEGAEEIVTMEIYRTLDLDTTAPNEIELYKSFGQQPHKILSIEDSIGNDGEGVDSSATAFDYIDTLLPNTKYFYTARSLDRHGKVSNPTRIYEVELVFDRGRYFPQVEVYHHTDKNNKKTAKGLVRYLEVKAADIQAQPFYESTDNPQDAQDSSWSIGLIEDSEDMTKNNSFIVRVTSRDTGRKIDLRLHFPNNITRQ